VFNLQGSEIIIVLLLALVVLGPEKLPDAMRKLGQAYAELKKMSSGFQSEFRSAVDEPMRELRNTANMLRDSADFTKLQTDEREEKPKSAEMGPLADPDEVPSAEIPTFDTPVGAEDADGPELAAASKPAPFSDESSVAPRPGPSAVPAPPPPFTGMSAPSESAPEDPAAGIDEPADANSDAEVEVSPAGGPDDAAGDDDRVDGVDAPSVSGDDVSPAGSSVDAAGVDDPADEADSPR
jgi:sec-independent protein translocase protein TatB